MKFKCLIVDDEPGAHVVLEKYISDITYLELCGQCYNAVEAYHFLKQHKVDIVLLDINMPKIDGFAFLEMVERPPMVIFTTAYSEYALKGFEYSAIDYLQKPIRFERFVKAIEKAIKWSNIRYQQDPVAIELRVDGKIKTVQLEDIDYAQSMGNYVKLFCGRHTIVANITTKELENLLKPPSFVRIHKSFIVSTAKVSAINGTELTINNKSLPVGKTFRKYISQFTLATEERKSEEQ